MVTTLLTSKCQRFFLSFLRETLFAFDVPLAQSDQVTWSYKKAFSRIPQNASYTIASASVWKAAIIRVNFFGTSSCVDKEVYLQSVSLDGGGSRQAFFGGLRLTIGLGAKSSGWRYIPSRRGRCALTTYTGLFGHQLPSIQKDTQLRKCWLFEESWNPIHSGVQIRRPVLQRLIH